MDGYNVERPVSPIQLPNIPWCTAQVPPLVSAHSTIDGNWSVYQKVFPLQGVFPAPSPFYPIIGNPSFPPSVGDPAFWAVIAESKFRASHFILLSVSHSRLTALTFLSTLGFCRLMQLSHYLSSLPKASDHQRPLTPFEEVCTQEGPASQMVSSMYSTLLSAHSDQALPFWA